MRHERLFRRLIRQGAFTLAGAYGVAACHAGWNPFSPGSPVKVGPRSGQIAIADFNGDGHGDILVSHPLHGRASLLLGDGRGEFPMTGRGSLEFGYDPAAIAVGDVNGDKRPDLAVTSRQGSTAYVHILLGNADGGFDEINDLGFAAYQIAERGWKPTLTMTDVNGDDKLDLISASGRQNTVNVFHGSGLGQFKLMQTIMLDEGFERYSHVVGDINGDSRLDLAAATSSSDRPGRLTVLLGDGQGQLVAAPELSREVPANSHVRTLCDIDGDKRRDVVLTHGAMTTVLIQQKDGGLTPSAGSPFDIGHEAFGIAAVNVGLNGNDVLVAATVNSLDVVYAEESGQFRHACDTPMPAGPGAYNVTTGDINGDGKVDIVTNSFEGNELALLLSN